RVAFVRLGRAFPPALPTLARVRLQRLSPIGNRRNPPPRAEKAANFFRSSASAREKNRDGFVGHAIQVTPLSSEVHMRQKSVAASFVPSLDDAMRSHGRGSARPVQLTPLSVEV